MSEPQVNYARDRARQQIQDYLRRGAEQGSSEAAAFAVEQYAWSMPWGETLRRGFVTENLGYGLYKHASFALMENDPNYDSQARYDEVRNSIPVNLWGHARRAKSEAELQAILRWGEDEKFSRSVLQHAGVPGAVATGLAAMFDVDMALGLLKGGSVIGPLLQQGTVMATAGRARRLGSVAYGMGVGLEAAVIGEVGNRFLKADYESAGLPAAALSGLTFGAGLGTVLPWHKMANKRTREIMETAVMRKQTGDEYIVDPTVTPDSPSARTAARQESPEGTDVAARTDAEDIVETAGTPEAPARKQSEFDPDASVGAAGIRGTYGVQINPQTAKLTEYSEEKLHEMGWSKDNQSAGRVGAIVDKIEDTLNMLPWLRTDQDVLLMSNSPSAQLFGLMALESSSGRHRVTNNTGGVLKEKYLPRITTNIAVGRNAYASWVKENGLKSNPETLKDWNKQVHNAMTSRYLDGKDPANLNAHMKAYMDEMDKNFKEALDLLQKADVYGARMVTWQPGWTPQRWSGKKMLDLTQLEKGRVSNEQIEEALTEGYLAANKMWTRKVAKAVAKAVITRSFTMEAGMDTSLISILQQDGRARLAETLINNGLSKRETEHFLDSVEGKLQERGKANILKSRNDIDTRVAIPGTQYTIADMLETDLMAVNLSYARSAAGLAALSKSTNGLIRSRADMDHLKEAIRNEQQVYSGGKEIPEDVLDHIWNGFAGGPLNQHTSAWVKRLVHLSNLSLLNQMGLTQLAETGVMIAYNGWESFTEGSAILKAILKDPKNPKWKTGLEELEEMGIPISGEHNLLRPDRMLDDFRITPDLSNLRGSDNELLTSIKEAFVPGGKADQVLMQGQRIQGYVSGFYLVRHAQIMLFTRSFMQTFGKLMNGTKTFSPARLKDMGFTDDAVFQRIQAEWKKNVTYTKLGNRDVVEKLNIHAWDKDVLEEYTSIMHRAIGQSIQKGMAGETSAWMSTTAGTVLANLRTFTLTGLKKQTLRHSRIADPVALASVLYGLPMAGAVYTARQVLNNNTDNLTTENIVKGAIGYSNLTAPIPMLSDPLTAILGMDSMQFGMFGARDFSGNYEFFPGMPAVETVNRIANIPGSVWALATGDGRAQDISNAQAIPILGNMLGVNAVFNGVKDSMRAQVARERSAEHRAKQKALREAEKAAGTPETAGQPAATGENINPSNVLEELDD